MVKCACCDVGMSSAKSNRPCQGIQPLLPVARVTSVIAQALSFHEKPAKGRALAHWV